jgi:hypothetical protein
MSDPCTVVIAAAALLPGLKGRFPADATLLTFEDADVVRALQAIVTHRPSLIVLERRFATTPRGTALIARVKSDSTLDGSEIRVMSHDGHYERTARRGRQAVSPAEEAPVPTLDPAGTRREPRVRIREGTDVRVDGNAVTLEDLSTRGAQVLSPTVLRPNQRVQVTLADSTGALSYRATIGWASFERLQKGAEPCYRAGIEFTNADTDALQAFCGRNAR